MEVRVDEEDDEEEESEVSRGDEVPLVYMYMCEVVSFSLQIWWMGTWWMSPRVQSYLLQYC